MVETVDLGLAIAVEVEDRHQGQRLDVFLSLALEARSRNRCQTLIRDGAVKIDGRVVRLARHKVTPGARIEVDLPPLDIAEPLPQALPLDIMYEDEALIVINKPAGMVVHPAPGNPDRTLVNALLHHCGETLAGIGGVRRPGIVHRLDKDTSGVMVVAKTEMAHNALAAQFADHGRNGPLERIYIALVWGRPAPPKGVINTLIGRSPRNRLKQTVLPVKGRRAITHYDTGVIWGAEKTAVSVLNCRLETGRTHQIRVHLAHLGHPILGDRVYGAGFSTRSAHLSPPAAAALKTLDRQALHAALLGFAHPVTGQNMRFSSPPPPDLQSLMDALEASVHILQ